MADARFFIKAPAQNLTDLAALCGAQLYDPASGDMMIDDIAPLSEAGKGQLSFLDNIRYRDAFSQTKAQACIVAEAMVPHAPTGCALLVSRNPYKSYALVAQAFYPETLPEEQIHEGAVIGQQATIGEGCVIEAGVVIGEGATIGAGTWIEANTVIGPNVVIGDKCQIGANATISHALIGNAVRIYPGVRIGQDGFGFAIDPAGHVKVPQLGRVIIEDHVEIGANSCIDRGAGPDTVIGAGTWIDNLVQIAHNVKIGRGCVLVAQCGVAGSSTLEDYAVIAAQAGVAGHLTIGRGARVGAQSGVMRSISPGEEHFGYPAQPIRETMRQIATLKRLTKAQKSE